MARSAEKQRAAKPSAPSLVAGIEENGRPDVGGAFHMTELDYVRGLIDAVDQSGIDSLEINRASVRIRISKTPAAAPWPNFAPPSSAPGLPHSPPAHAAPAPAPASASSAPVEAPAAATAPKSNLVDVTSPMVGTFYRAPAPDAPPYVERGTSVGKGQTLCILEAMKLMNELPSEIEGVVRDILVEDADPVEYGQVLFRIEPAVK